VRPHLAYFWQSLSESDRRLLALLPISWHGEAESMTRLEHENLVVRTASGIVTFSKAFRDFVAQQQVLDVCQAVPVTLDMQQHVALLRDRPLALTPTEFNLLRCLVENPGRLITHAELQGCLGEDGSAGNATNSANNDAERVKTTLKSLRQALGADAVCIENERGLGYRFIRAGD
jgi:DNA-binding response OmpR family regulator